MNSIIDKDHHMPTSSTHLKLNTHSKSISETSSQKRSLVTQPPNNRITKQAKHEQDILQNSNTNIRARLAAQAHAEKILNKSLNDFCPNPKFSWLVTTVRYCISQQETEPRPHNIKFENSMEAAKVN